MFIVDLFNSRQRLEAKMRQRLEAKITCFSPSAQHRLEACARRVFDFAAVTGRRWLG